MIPGIRRNQKYANGVTSSATRKVTSRARGSVLRGLPLETAPTEAITTTAWTSQEAILITSHVMEPMIDRAMTPDIPITQEFLHALPKTDLHCHLDGSLRLKTMLELAEQQGVKLPADTEDGLAKAMKIGQRHGSLEEYLKGFDITLSVLQTQDALYRAAYELAIDAAGENRKLIEVRYARRRGRRESSPASSSAESGTWAPTSRCASRNCRWRTRTAASSGSTWPAR